MYCCSAVSTVVADVDFVVIVVVVATGEADAIVRASYSKIIPLVGVHLDVVSLLGVVINLFLRVK